MTGSRPHRVFLFTGHMIDAPGRGQPRFPSQLQDAAASEIAAAVDHWGATPDDLALCGGAGGGDLIFAEVCIARGVRLEVLLPFEEERFLAASVDKSGAE